VRSLVLVKHSLPLISPRVTAADWRLSPEGIARCAALAERLRAFTPRTIASSVEPKAAETARQVGDRLGVPVKLVLGLHEHDRRDATVLGDAAFERAIAALFAAPFDLVFGRETAAAALARFDLAVAGLLAAAPPDDDVIAVSHGTVISLFVAAHTGSDGLALWRRLGLPSLIVLRRADLGIDRVEASVAG
jgi:broad specificity phosphatase PhoE